MDICYVKYLIKSVKKRKEHMIPNSRTQKQEKYRVGCYSKEAKVELNIHKKAAWHFIYLLTVDTLCLVENSFHTHEA